MKREEIEVGKTYWDGKKGLRKVLEIGPDGHGSECVEYALLSGRKNGTPLKREAYQDFSVYGCYTQSFQLWAKQIVEFGPDALK